MHTSEETPPYDPFSLEGDWRRPELQRQLRIGTELEADDGGRFTVLNIRADGFETHGLFTPRTLFTWDDMTKYAMVIVRQPEPGVLPTPGPCIRQRGGRFKREDIHALRASSEAVRDSKTMDMLLVAELGRHGPSTSPGLLLNAVAQAEGGFQLEIQDLDGNATCVAPKLGLRVAVARLYEWTEECQGTPWTSLVLKVVREANDTWTYEVSFQYDR